jgi:uncharacterized repeat protein (TIGR03803 family)
MTKLNGWKTGCAWLAVCVVAAITSHGQTLNTLVSFDMTDGLWPDYQALSQGLDGNLYGTTSYGGDGRAECDSGCGTVFKVTTGGELTSLYSFCMQAKCPDGANPPQGLLQVVDGNFFGTNLGGGANGGTVFKITPSGKLTTLYRFCGRLSCSDGSGPDAALIEGTDGNLYGTTANGGMSGVAPGCPQGCGTIYRIGRSGILTTLHRFNVKDGSLPYGRLVQATDGAFYGTTSAGGANYYGTVFKITEDGTFTVLHSFDGNDGATPYAGLVQATDGNFYGTTYGGGGGKFCGGTIFKITPDGVLTMLYNFGGASGCNHGAFPSAALVEATDGNLYGTTSEGGGPDCENGGCGTIFKITKTGTLTTLAEFDGSDGTLPYGGLVQDTNGTFYGAAFQGGAYLAGTVYSLDVGLGPFVTFVQFAARVGQTGPILGQGLTGTTGVSINGIPAEFTVVSDTYIKATVPPGATTGYVTVTTPTGILTSNVPFHVIP